MRRTFTCTSITADEPTINKRIYPKRVLESFVEQCNDLGEMLVTDGLDGPTVNLQRVAGRARDFALDPSGRIIATVEVLDTPSGMIIKGLLDDVDFSPMMFGTVNDDGVVQDDVRIAYFALTPKDR